MSARDQRQISAFDHMWADRSRHVSINAELDRRFTPALRDVGIGIRIEVRRGEEFIEAIDIAGSK